MQKGVLRVVSGIIFVAGALVVVYAWIRAEEKMKPAPVQAANVYDADIQPYEQVPLDPAVILLTPYELAQAPLADVFTYPLGSEWGAFVYDAQPAGTPNDGKGGRHLGKDLNGIGGMNTDFGDPVYAAGRGKVIFCGEPSPDWGKVVVLLHRLPDGRYLQTLYAHLSKINVYYGELVPRGKMIGEVGSAGGRYPAHLHFEMIESIGNEAGLPGYAQEMGNRIDPSLIFRQYPPSDKTLLPDPLLPLQKIQLRDDLSEMVFPLIQDEGDKTGK